VPRVPWLRALPPRQESSGAAMCSSALDLASLLRWAPALPRGPSLTFPSGLCTTGIKKGLAASGT
jgi:hypothetical protein